MTALVRRDTAVEVVCPRAMAEIRPDEAEIPRLYDALDCVSETNNPRTARLLASGHRRSRKH